MKKLIAILAIIGVLLQTVNQFVIVAEYYAQKEYIAKNLCENRDKPAMHCEGKCCLKKRLAKEGKDQLPSSRNQKQEIAVAVFFNITPFAVNPHVAEALPADYTGYNESYTASFHHSVFRPPIV